MTRGLLLDIDGVLVISWRPIPGAPEALRWLRGRDIPKPPMFDDDPVAPDHVIDSIADLPRLLE